VDEMRRALDLELHEIEQVGAAADELRARPCSGHGGGSRVGRALVRERSHRGAPPATCRIAATMLGKAPQRQMLPLIRSRISASVSSMSVVATSGVAWLGTFLFASSSIATAEQIWPDVQ